MPNGWLLIGGVLVSIMVVVLALIRGDIVYLTPDLPEPPLHVLASRHGISLGNYAARDRLNEKPYRDILTSEFSFISIHGQPNWAFEDDAMRPAPNTFDFNRIDNVLDFAQANGKPARMHHFVWGEEKWLPSWLKDSDYSKEELLRFMREHILTVGGHFKGKVREWTVVNEAFTRGLHEKGLNDWWADNTGGMDYIDKAFIWARQADPDAVLILNDFNNESDNRISDAMYEYLKNALKRGVPIDGLGMQMHINGHNPPDKQDVINNMRRFAKLGLDIYVTEFDVNMNDGPGSVNEKLSKQADVYYDMLRACIESKVCVSFALIGITDKETWYNELGVPGAIPLPFDRQYKPKPAYYKMRQALQEGDMTF